MVPYTCITRGDVYLRCWYCYPGDYSARHVLVALPPTPTRLVEYGPRIVEEEWKCQRMWEVWHLLPGGNYHCYDAEELFVLDEEG